MSHDYLLRNLGHSSCDVNSLFKADLVGTSQLCLWSQNVVNGIPPCIVVTANFVLSFYSPDMPENEATFSITAGGVNDAKE